MESTQVLLDSFDDISFASGKKRQLVGHLFILDECNEIFSGKNVIGRSDSCDVSINSKTVSTEHAIIDYKQGGCHMLYDLDSTNKTKLGKVTLEPDVRYNIRDGDTIMFADIKAIYRYAEGKLNTSLKDEEISEAGSESLLCAASDCESEVRIHQGTLANHNMGVIEGTPDNSIIDDNSVIEKTNYKYMIMEETACSGSGIAVNETTNQHQGTDIYQATTSKSASNVFRTPQAPNHNTDQFMSLNESGIYEAPTQHFTSEESTDDGAIVKVQTNLICSDIESAAFNSHQTEKQCLENSTVKLNDKTECGLPIWKYKSAVPGSDVYEAETQAEGFMDAIDRTPVPIRKHVQAATDLYQLNTQCFNVSAENAKLLQTAGIGIRRVQNGSLNSDSTNCSNKSGIALAEEVMHNVNVSSRLSSEKLGPLDVQIETVEKVKSYLSSLSDTSTGQGSENAVETQTSQSSFRLYIDDTQMEVAARLNDSTVSGNESGERVPPLAPLTPADENGSFGSDVFDVPTQITSVGENVKASVRDCAETQGIAAITEDLLNAPTQTFHTNKQATDEESKYKNNDAIILNSELNSTMNSDIFDVPTQQNVNNQIKNYSGRHNKSAIYGDISRLDKNVDAMSESSDNYDVPTQLVNRNQDTLSESSDNFDVPTQIVHNFTRNNDHTKRGYLGEDKASSFSPNTVAPLKTINEPIESNSELSVDGSLDKYSIQSQAANSKDLEVLSASSDATDDDLHIEPSSLCKPSTIHNGFGDSPKTIKSQTVEKQAHPSKPNNEVEDCSTDSESLIPPLQENSQSQEHRSNDTSVLTGSQNLPDNKIKKLSSLENVKRNEPMADSKCIMGMSQQSKILDQNNDQQTKALEHSDILIVRELDGGQNKDSTVLKACVKIGTLLTKSCEMMHEETTSKSVFNSSSQAEVYRESGLSSVSGDKTVSSTSTLDSDIKITPDGTRSNRRQVTMTWKLKEYKNNAKGKASSSRPKCPVKKHLAALVSPNILDNSEKTFNDSSTPNRNVKSLNTPFNSNLNTMQMKDDEGILFQEMRFTTESINLSGGALKMYDDCSQEENVDKTSIDVKQGSVINEKSSKDNVNVRNNLIQKIKLNNSPPLLENLEVCRNETLEEKHGSSCTLKREVTVKRKRFVGCEQYDHEISDDKGDMAIKNIPGELGSLNNMHHSASKSKRKLETAKKTTRKRGKQNFNCATTSESDTENIGKQVAAISPAKRSNIVVTNISEEINNTLRKLQTSSIKGNNERPLIPETTITEPHTFTSALGDLEMPASLQRTRSPRKNDSKGSANDQNIVHGLSDNKCAVKVKKSGAQYDDKSANSKSDGLEMNTKTLTLTIRSRKDDNCVESDHFITVPSPSASTRGQRKKMPIADNTAVLQSKTSSSLDDVNVKDCTITEVTDRPSRGRNKELLTGIGSRNLRGRKLENIQVTLTEENNSNLTTSSKSDKSVASLVETDSVDLPDKCNLLKGRKHSVITPSKVINERSRRGKTMKVPELAQSLVDIVPRKFESKLGRQGTVPQDDINSNVAKNYKSGSTVNPPVDRDSNNSSDSSGGLKHLVTPLEGTKSQRSPTRTPSKRGRQSKKSSEHQTFIGATTNEFDTENIHCLDKQETGISLVAKCNPVNTNISEENNKKPRKLPLNLMEGNNTTTLVAEATITESHIFTSALGDSETSPNESANEKHESPQRTRSPRKCAIKGTAHDKNIVQEKIDNKSSMKKKKCAQYDVKSAISECDVLKTNKKILTLSIRSRKGENSGEPDHYISVASPSSSRRGQRKKVPIADDTAVLEGKRSRSLEDANLKSSTGNAVTDHASRGQTKETPERTKLRTGFGSRNLRGRKLEKMQVTPIEGNINSNLTTSNVSDKSMFSSIESDSVNMPDNHDPLKGRKRRVITPLRVINERSKRGKAMEVPEDAQPLGDIVPRKFVSKLGRPHGTAPQDNISHDVATKYKSDRTVYTPVNKNSNDSSDKCEGLKRLVTPLESSISQRSPSKKMSKQAVKSAENNRNWDKATSSNNENKEETFTNEHLKISDSIMYDVSTNLSNCLPSDTKAKQLKKGNAFFVIPKSPTTPIMSRSLSRSNHSKERELITPGASPETPEPTVKRLRLRSSSSESTQSSHSTVSTPTASTEMTPRKRQSYLVMFTTVLSDLKLEAAVRKLGGKVVESPQTSTVLVASKVRRTVKFLCMMGRGQPIVSVDWLHASTAAKTFQDPWNYLISDAESEAKFSFSLEGTLRQAQQKSVMSGCSVFVTKSVLPCPEEMKSIIECCGGVYLSREPSAWASNSFVVSTPADKGVWNRLKKRGITPPIFSAEGILSGVLQHNINSEQHRLDL